MSVMWLWRITGSEQQDQQENKVVSQAAVLLFTVRVDIGMGGAILFVIYLWSISVLLANRVHHLRS